MSFPMRNYAFHFKIRDGYPTILVTGVQELIVG
jgi:hypothetical protein